MTTSGQQTSGQSGKTKSASMAESYLRLLHNRGVEILLGNGGTDFAPLIEAFAKAQVTGDPVPRPITVPHENVAVAMAHGYHMVSGRIAAVMVHVGLGTANSINGIANAARQQVPILFTAGRTPLVEEGLPGARNNYIHWAQEMFDQAGMVRELVKWDYELRHPVQLESVLDRALAIAQSEPKGPVYLTLPREVLAMPDAREAGVKMTIAPATPARPDAAAIAEARALLAKAKRPVIITSCSGRTAQGVEFLARLAERYSAPVVEYRPRYLCLPHDHPMHAGWDPDPFVADADFILVVESDVPWLPSQVTPPPECSIVHLGADPLFARYPVRSFKATLAITGDVVSSLAELAAKGAPEDRDAASARVQRLAQMRAAREKQAIEAVAAAENGPVINSALLSHCIAEICDEDTILINEYPLALEQMKLRHPERYFLHSPAGGLGWGLGAALGAKIAEPEKTVIACVGDGAYMFGNPTPAHFVGRAMELPTLTVIFNNAMWVAVHRSTLAMYPDGYAARANEPPLSMLDPPPAYEMLVEASGGYGECVRDPADLKAALQRALHAVRVEKRQAVLNVMIQRIYQRTS
jgi:acetolactate synthase-1/2/3 large subunit